jgi:hypothetical protein
MTTVPYTFGNESSPIPLSQLDANFAVTPQYANTAGNIVNGVQANITSVGTLTALSVSGNINSGNLRTTGSVSATGNINAGNITTGGTVSAFGTITGGNFATTGTVSATGTATVGNILTGGFISATGNITGGNVTTSGRISAQGNILAQGIVSAIGNIVTNANFVGNFLGNITGNLSVGGSNTQVLFNLNGNVGAAGGLTYNSGSNTLGILGVVSAQGNISGGNLIVAGTTQLVGVATAPTAPAGTANNQIATTAFVITNGVPSGCILLWSGSIISIPGGWYLCDGTNGTPNLADRFVVGAGSTYNVADIGGSANAVVVSHTHTANSVVSDPSHNHNSNSVGLDNISINWVGTGGLDYNTSGSQLTANATTGITVATSISTAGVSGTNANLPPYYALAYIMKA